MQFSNLFYKYLLGFLFLVALALIEGMCRTANFICPYTNFIRPIDSPSLGFFYKRFTNAFSSCGFRNDQTYNLSICTFRQPEIHQNANASNNHAIFFSNNYFAVSVIYRSYVFV